MSRKKLNAFTADDAGDKFTPTVKMIKGANVGDIIVEEASPEEKATGQTKKDRINAGRKSKAKPVPKTKSRPEVKSKIEEKVPVRQEQAQIQKKDEEKSPVKKDAMSMDMRQKDHEYEQGSEKIVQLVGFVLGNEEYGVDIQKVQEINRILEITRVPRTPDFIMGVINLRGNVIPVINMRQRFGLPLKENDKNTRIIVVEIQNKIIGILVDAVSEVLRIPAGTIEPPPDIVMGIDTKYIEGVGKLQDRLLILLDLNRFLSHDQTGKLEEIEKSMIQEPIK